MKKALVLLGTAVLMVLSASLAACSGGTPKPPVKKLLDLDKLVMENMTLDQVNILMTPTLNQTGTLYPATRVEKSAKGNWIVQYKEENVKQGETAPFQVLFFPPSKAVPNKYYAIFLKGNMVIGKSWFDLQGGAVIESDLKGGE